ncbi:A49-like RNA polymerase I associated factor-domain-containing protein [Aspergillus alliaceus]|uniref:A49-like RNA polymerase I associated factor-domain-containing protein n=1 Tax=Petromyces alliaceus TaxID=209559 RepID=A0A5N6FRJ1_PETAA|nr:A49-like RNA polymerase I associated factor-domain-containing protein [Aspergillus alliaceus]KAB8232109.1 A49-like RNA polymerase I associated factor-domain-containing protein [Aspergillus alliaceus]KAE8385608.1 A49-like RNA polymerase I associated factor-domain-containing protein [Aspergillus alliaceus]
MPSDKVEKKRKRASNGHERPSKKPALELQDLPPLAVSVLDDDSELAPVIVTTPGVNAPQNLRLKPYLKDRAHGPSPGRSTRNKGIVSSELLLQTSEHPKMDFVGREAEDDADSQLKHYIAVVDPEKKSWQFVEVRKLTLRGAVRRIKVAAEEEEEVESEDEEMKTLRAQRTELTNTFGTKQSRKAAQSMAENAQLSNAPAGAASAAESAILSSMPLDSATDIATKTAAVQAQVQANKPLPQANLAASHPSDVYPIDVLVPGGLSTLQQLPGINVWEEAVSSGQAVATTSQYVSRRLEAVVNSTNATQIQILRFIFLLFEFSRALRSGNLKSSSGPGSKRLPPREELRRILSSPTGAESDTTETLPDPVIDAIRRKFAPQGSYLTKNDVTYLHTTICALSLLIPPQPAKDGGSSSQGGNAPNELATDPSDLRDDLRVESTAILQYFRELGCRIDKPRESEFAKWNIKGGKAEANTRRVARLRVPVEFPKVSRGGKR